MRYQTTLWSLLSQARGENGQRNSLQLHVHERAGDRAAQTASVMRTWKSCGEGLIYQFQQF